MKCGGGPVFLFSIAGRVDFFEILIAYRAKLANYHFKKKEMLSKMRTKLPVSVERKFGKLEPRKRSVDVSQSRSSPQGRVSLSNRKVVVIFKEEKILKKKEYMSDQFLNYSLFSKTVSFGKLF